MSRRKVRRMSPTVVPLRKLNAPLSAVDLNYGRTCVEGYARRYKGQLWARSVADLVGKITKSLRRPHEFGGPERARRVVAHVVGDLLRSDRLVFSHDKQCFLLQSGFTGRTSRNKGGLARERHVDRTNVMRFTTA